MALAGCGNGNDGYDASGAFESVETIVSTEASGTIMEFNVEEGKTLQPNQLVGYVDSTQLYLRKKQLEAQNESRARILQLPYEPMLPAARLAATVGRCRAAGAGKLDAIPRAHSMVPLKRLAPNKLRPSTAQD